MAVCVLLVLLPAGDAYPTALLCSFLKERPTSTEGKSFPENTEIKQKKKGKSDPRFPMQARAHTRTHKTSRTPDISRPRQAWSQPCVTNSTTL